jgi:hypothetical protein
MLDGFMKLSRQAQLVLGGSVLYVILSFFNWQEVSIGGFSAGVDEWHGVGVIAALLAIVLLLWELARLFNIEVPIGSLTPGLASVGVALLLLLFTVITFLSHSSYRAWPEWVGLVLSIVIGGAAVQRAKSEGVEMPKMPAAASMGGATTAAAAPPSAPAEDAGAASSEESG